jgi:glycosyltransferase involved in cell wall biosynthesis
MKLELNTNPLISIVMPTYNQCKFLPHSIDSVLSQSFTNWELLIVDNFSTDETANVLATYSDPRIKVMRINNGGIIAKSRNVAIKASKGAWIAFLDSDDHWFPNKLETVSKYFHSNCDLIYHNLEVVTDMDKVFESGQIKSRKLRKPVLKDLLINGNTIATSSVVVRKKQLVEVNYMSESPELIGIEDYITWLRISRVTEAFHLVPIALGVYRRHENNISLSKHPGSLTEALREFFPILSDYDKRSMSLNNLYASARLKYLNKNYQNLEQELVHLVINGNVSIKAKSLLMLILLFKNQAMRLNLFY